MARQPRTKSEESSLLQALKFCSVVSEKVGNPNETHIKLHDNLAIATNGIVTVGCPIKENFSSYPHTLLLIEALSKSSDSFSFTQLNGSLSIKSGKFKAVIPCLDVGLAPSILPDAQIAPINNDFKTAVEAVGVLADENSDNVLTASVLMSGPTVVSTNRAVIFEYWHGLDLPSNISLPKQFTTALVKQKKNLAGFGFSTNSATFWFDDGSWLKTQLYHEKWPNVSRILDRQSNLWTIDTTFFQALAAVTPFSEDGSIYFGENLLMSHSDASKGATFECSGIPQGVIYPAKHLAMLKGHVDKIDFKCKMENGYCLAFQGEKMRGVIAGRQC